MIVGGSAFRCDDCDKKLTPLDLQGQKAETKDGEEVVSMARTPTGGIMMPHTCEGCARKAGFSTYSSTLADRIKAEQKERSKPRGYGHSSQRDRKNW